MIVSYVNLPVEHGRSMINSAVIDKIYDSSDFDSAMLDDLKSILDAMDRGELRVSEFKSGQWSTNQAAKKAILCMFKAFNCNLTQNSDGFAGYTAYDKVPLKFAAWQAQDFANKRIRCVPGAIVRYTAHISEGVILMPCFVNVAAFVGKNTMIDTWATVGSCAYIGANCHISGGTGIGGVLEPIQSSPVIIEDNCLIGARSEIVEGVIVGQGSVIGMGVFIGASTKIINRDTGEIVYGHIPPNSVVVSGSYSSNNGLSVGCAIIVKTVDQSTMNKTQRNDLLRL